MRKFDANCWELYHNKIPTIKNSPKIIMKQKRAAYNSFMVGNAKKYARSMRKNPSELEVKMKHFLDNQKIHYEFQKILFVMNSNGYVARYYIVDFFFPQKGIILETDGKFHEEQSALDDLRTKDIQNHCGNYKVIRWRWHDFESITKMKKLLSLLV